ncbi:conserved hypothetical protein [Leishmania mexicana MHOM/GT/2001/U1103]|uniref:Uncharacterized protein n=1 Tax=Leishmania mexicana (strain MHOM/GT/2001/U1103) TaxID=929439 RepID=E9AVL4_LEIMU|nr:conserved hypothetical protein [Leishmania mexicana MHOM/GT/2001/U1103]CBZ26997.1 conserved hypothetical protein [Leishmania mexicana MHOM/GT/2001/U1103]
MAPKRKAASKTSPAAEEAVHDGCEEHSTTPFVEAPVAAAEGTATARVAEPAAPVLVVGSTTEMYSQLQSILSVDGALVNHYLPQVLELVQAAESVETPILLRVRFLEFVGQHVASVRDNNALRKVVTSLVKIVGGADNTPQLLTAAVQAFAGLGPVSVVDKNWEYLAREGADVLMQVMVDRDAFPESVRQAASKSLDSLTSSAFRSVLAKLLHWLSLDREEDDEEQVQKERHMALARLTRLIMAPSQRKHWTEETQLYAEPLLQRVLSTVDVREFAQLARVTSHLPINQDKGNLPLLEWYVKAHRLNDERHVEAVAIIGRFVSSSVEFDLYPALEAAGITSRDIDASSDGSVNTAKVVLLASRLATEEAAKKLYPYVYRQVVSLMSEMRGTLTTANLITVEALLFAAVALARKRSAEALQQLNDASFNATAISAAQAAADVYKQVVFAVKKAAQNKQADGTSANAVASLNNIKTITEAFAAKRLPLGEIKESWTRGPNSIPVAKRDREAPRGAMPPPPGVQSAVEAGKKRSSSSQNAPDRKRARNDHRGQYNDRRSRRGDRR